MNKLLRFLVVFTSLSMIVINALANIVPYNGLSTAAISDSFKVFFVPAGYVFAIWGIIYIGILVYCFYQARNNNPVFDKVAPYVIIGNIANSVWIFAWHYLLIPLTLPLMLILLGSLVVTYLIIYNAKGINRLFALVPFGIYLGWISVATVANITDFLDYFGVKSLVIDGQPWAALLILIAGALGIFFILKFKEFAYPLVIIWAVIGIAAKFPSISIITTAAYFVAALLFIALVYKSITSNKNKI